jgi:hypothetical protein
VAIRPGGAAAFAQEVTVKRSMAISRDANGFCVRIEQGRAVEIYVALDFEEARAVSQEFWSRPQERANPRRALRVA